MHGDATFHRVSGSPCCSYSHTDTHIHKQTSGFVQDKESDLVLYYGSYVFFSIKKCKTALQFYLGSYLNLSLPKVFPINLP